eukprot:1353348-Alexandrium_andersonii.AAC.1
MVASVSLMGAAVSFGSVMLPKVRFSYARFVWVRAFERTESCAPYKTKECLATSASILRPTGSRRKARPAGTGRCPSPPTRHNCPST